MKQILTKEQEKKLDSYSNLNLNFTENQLKQFALDDYPQHSLREDEFYSKKLKKYFKKKKLKYEEDEKDTFIDICHEIGVSDMGIIIRELSAMVLKERRLLNYCKQDVIQLLNNFKKDKEDDNDDLWNI